MLGEPQEETRIRKNDKSLRQISWTYVNDAETPKVPNTIGTAMSQKLLNG